jgi:hypothetical protein
MAVIEQALRDAGRNPALFHAEKFWRWRCCKRRRRAAIGIIRTRSRRPGTDRRLSVHPSGQLALLNPARWAEGAKNLYPVLFRAGRFLRKASGGKMPKKENE